MNEQQTKEKEVCEVADGQILHRGAKLDHFSRLPGVRRAVPGDCICATCGQPIPYRWNEGRPYPVSEASERV